MKILTTPWKNEFFELVTNSKKSIKITSPFVKKDIANEMLRIKSKETKIELFTSFKLMNIYSGLLDIDAIQNIIDSDGIVRNYPRLHSKIYIFDDEKAIITSGNLTNGGLVKNFEYGAFIDESSLVKQICLDFNNLRLNENTGIIKRKDLDLVKEILSKIPKIEKVRIPDFEIETPEESYDIIETPLEPILNSLTG
jgi:phosphatidylserine/phosphatidylglycerophosphate/cardiolipin synthase-like enzyme